MVKGEAHQSKIHFKGKEDDFVIFVDDVATFKKWKNDSSIPMAHFISTFNIFVTHKQGAQGTLDSASKATLENEFGTATEEDAIKQILEKGSLQESEFPDRQGNKNDAQQVNIVAGQTVR